MPGPFCVRRAPALPRRRFLSRPRRLCSQPSWRRRVGSVPGGHRFSRRLIPGNRALQRVPIEPFVQRPQKRAFSCGKVLVHSNRTSTGTNMGDLAHLSPLGCEHIKFTGDYHWDTSPTLGPDEFRALRTHAHDFAAAAPLSRKATR